MPSGNSMACGDAAKGERTEGFFFIGDFTALVMTSPLVKCALRVASVEIPTMARSEFIAAYRNDRTERFSQDCLRYAAGNAVRNSTPPVRSHDNEIAGQSSGRIQD